MKTIPVRLSNQKSYPIHIGMSLGGLGKALRPFQFSRSLLVISAPPIARRYARPLLAGMKSAGFHAQLALMPDGEEFKTVRTVEALYRQCLKSGLDRRSAIVALGGGVVGDVAGFVAASYMRGLPFIQCPTTLLSMVDASVGGKVGVDLPEGKNLVGAFWQPRLVWMDLSVLQTLPDREWRTGLAEVVKYGLIADERIIRVLEKIDLSGLRRNPAVIEKIVSRSAGIKADVVSRDEKETRGLREVLNMGHTFGHAIEAVTGYKTYTHGEAISIGMCAAGRLGVALHSFGNGDLERLKTLLSRWGLETRVRKALPRAQIIRAMARDKKVLSGQFRFVVPEGWGRVRVVKGVPQTLVRQALSEVGIS
ncbi:MAG: 3-dehydroquinate synthase [Elusimicrobia bacterium]|nr:3-dehydroquinate synthase [Elusimicrobiota bacterium]